MIEYRLLKAEEYKLAVELADQTFRDDEHISMGEAFPFVFSPGLNQGYGAFFNGELVSFIGLVPSIIHIGSAEVQAYSIGAVCTKTEHRRNGHANALLKKVFEHCKKADASILFVSGNLPIYLKAGCSFYGNLNKYEIQEHSLPQRKNEEYAIREFSPYDWFNLLRLAQSRLVRFEQSILDFSVLNSARGFASIHKMNHKIMVAESRNEIKGFVVLGVRPSSLNGSTSRVIEWGGDADAVYSILARSFQEGIKEIKFSIPSYEKTLNHLLEPSRKTETTFPGTVKIMNLDLFLKQLAPYLKEYVEIKDVDADHKKLLINQKSVTIDHSTLEQLLLLGKQHLDPDLNDIFPVPLPFPEGLNYI